MPLTELIIDGFKSFAQKTTINFNNGITGIVGPNGSGKSNITEAIRWAMGEASAKSLRGNNMKDIIFAGSEFRKPLNSAQVTLVFDNHDHQLNFKDDKVSVTRRILRSGDSDYLINGQSVRLKDVRELFLDSGISQNSLAIISQGRVDQILNSRPEDRREIFEEAAGVLHFKQQKAAAQGQLEKTNDNLIRINDLVKELEQRIEPLHEQSSLAKEYKFQRAGLDKDIKMLYAFQIQTLNEEKVATQQKAEKNQVLLSKLDNEVKESQAAVSEKREEYQALQDKREEIQTNLLNLTQKLSELNTNLQIAEQSKQFDDATKAEYKNQINDLKEQIKQLQESLVSLRKEQDKISASRKALQADRKELTKKVTENPDDLSKQLEDLRNDYIQVLQDQTSSNNQLVYLKTELKRTNEDTSYRNNDVSNQLEKAQASLEALRENGKKLTATRKEKQDIVQKLTNEQNDLLDQQNKLRGLVNIEKSELQRNIARRDALINIQKRHEGYYFGVRNVLNHLDNYPGVIGAVGELISFSSDLEAAITTALGSGVQDLISDSRISARNAINTLKKEHAGRATFLPLDGLRQYSIPSSTITTLKSFSGFIGIASDLVESSSDVDITPAINYLLGSVMVVDTIDTAMKVNKRVGRYRIVTLDGDVISPGGSMTGGQRNQRSNSPLQTTAEINALKQKVEKLEKQLNLDQHDLEEITDRFETCNEKLNKSRAELQDANQELSEAAITFQNQEKEVKRLVDADKLFSSRIHERDERISKIKAEIEQEHQKQDELGQAAEASKQKIAEIQDRIKNFTSLNEKIQKQLAELDPKIAVLEAKRENLASQIRDKQSDLDDSQKQLSEIETKLEKLSSNGELSNQKKADIQKQTVELTEQKDKMQEELNSLAGKLGQVDAQINQLDQVASRNYELRKDAALEQESYSVEVAKLNSSINQKLETLSSDYSLTYEAALSQAEVENTEENRAKLQRSVKLHKMSLEDIGPVNLDAIEEYEKVKTRYDFLNGQQNDLLAAREDLENSMDELDKEVKTRFSQTFDKINEGFSKIFPVVFGGGNAKLVLTEPDNMLTTGIEIIAQPPGKKLQRLSLLSGGERALTAITLLFAMLQINPVPFCVLDEVEAALDDANVTRFAKFLKKYDMHTQFIVITHRRGTMEEADQLFGVVMQESGVSQVLSVSLKDVKDEVN